MQRHSFLPLERRVQTAFVCALTLFWALSGNVAGQDVDRPGAIRRLTSTHLTLYTDLPSSPEVDALPQLFDQAFPQWCAYFGIDPAQHANWQARGHLMRSREAFAAGGFIPGNLPDFASGYSISDSIWCLDQSSEYYRRHLLLHEGTHAFMHSLVGGVGPAWYAEGMAELLATHLLVDGKLKLNYFPTARVEVSKWGRIEIVQTDYAARKAKTLARVMSYDPRMHDENEWYGWSWAAVAFLDGHPRYRERFRQLPKLVARPDFNADVASHFGADWQRLQEDWQLFVANIDYGYDFARMDVEFIAGKPLPPEGATATVATDRSWQAAGVRLEAGKRYRLRAKGRYQLADQPRVWWCEPNGVSIRYYHGQPLGILLAAVRADDGATGSSGLVLPQVVGLETVLTAPRDGTLYLRINDAPDSLADNVGTATVEIAPE
jgi:hypothetical protein